MVSKYLIEADMLTGAHNDGETIRLWATHIVRLMKHRSVASILMAIRDGVGRKVYGKLTYPQVVEWMDDHEQKILAHVENQAAQHRFTGDNLGADYMDRMERASEGSQLKRANHRIQQLEQKLRTKDQP